MASAGCPKFGKTSEETSQVPAVPSAARPGVSLANGKSVTSTFCVVVAVSTCGCGPDPDQHDEGRRVHGSVHVLDLVGHGLGRPLLALDRGEDH